MASPSASSSSDTSPSSSPASSMRYPCRAFVNAMTIPFKSPPSLPSTHTIISDLSFTPSSSTGTISPISSNSYAHCAYPDWPKSDILSSSSSTASSPSPYFGTSSPSSSGCQASSYISDEDLLDLETLPLYNNIRIPREMLVAVTPPMERRRPSREGRCVVPAHIQQASLPEVRPVPVVSQTQLQTKRRRRSSPLKKRALVLGMSPIAEGAE